MLSNGSHSWELKKTCYKKNFKHKNEENEIMDRYANHPAPSIINHGQSCFM